VFGCTGHVGKDAICPYVAASHQQQHHFCGVFESSVRPKSSRSRFDTANPSSFRIAAIDVRMLGARLQARRSSGRCRFDQQQHHFCGVFGSSVHLCVPSQVAPVSTPQGALHSGLLPSVFWMHGAHLQARFLIGRGRFDQQQHHLCGSGASQVKLLPFNTARRTSFWIAAIGVRMNRARLQACFFAGLCVLRNHQLAI